jgi:hypothetical protein
VEPINDALNHLPMITKRSSTLPFEDGINDSIRAH